jgi:hypothetical protein
VLHIYPLYICFVIFTVYSDNSPNDVNGHGRCDYFIQYKTWDKIFVFFMQWKNKITSLYLPLIMPRGT